MRYSQLYAPTLKEAPTDAEVISHRLMMRAGLIKKVASGVYNLLPLGYRVIRKVENIIREEMDRQGAQELLLAALQPAELWQESGRWEMYGPELMRLKDRHERDFCLGPTHEEVITDVVRKDIKSYRQLPVNLYQIQTKFRDEIRPRFGLMRGREFIMKDAYSFDKDQQGLDISYEKMRIAYCRIFERCGLKYSAVEADSGSIGGNSSHEFMVLAATGEDSVAFCPSCNYGANVEKADYKTAIRENTDEEIKVKELVSTPNVHTVQEVAAFLDMDEKKIIKTIIAVSEKDTYAIMVRGDREINEVKVKNLLGVKHFAMAGPDTVKKVTQSEIGFAGPCNLQNIVMVADEEVMQMKNAVCGGNKTDMHYINVQPDSDFSSDIVANIRMIVDGDSCPKCGQLMQIVRGIEVGHIFKLGTKYSESMDATFIDEDGTAKPFIMGCYGIGVGRTMASSIEQNHDENGIIWPMAIAPYHVVIIPVKPNDEEQKKHADELYVQLMDNGIEAIVDDRDERAGVKFMDADLIGFPIKITIGQKSLERGIFEMQLRREKEKRELPIADACTLISEIVKKEINNSVLRN